jgi:hypothetical protein
MESSNIYASGALECPLPRSPNTTTAIAINTPIAAPNAAIDASAMAEMLKVNHIYYW